MKYLLEFFKKKLNFRLCEETLNFHFPHLHLLFHVTPPPPKKYEKETQAGVLNRPTAPSDYQVLSPSSDPSAAHVGPVAR